jgi:hypothetical protein
MKRNTPLIANIFSRNFFLVHSKLGKQCRPVSFINTRSWVTILRKLDLMFRLVSVFDSVMASFAFTVSQIHFSYTNTLLATMNNSERTIWNRHSISSREIKCGLPSSTNRQTLTSLTISSITITSLVGFYNKISKTRCRLT